MEFINLIFYLDACAFHTVTCQNTFNEGLLVSSKWLWRLLYILQLILTDIMWSPAPYSNLFLSYILIVGYFYLHQKNNEQKSWHRLRITTFHKHTWIRNETLSNVNTIGSCGSGLVASVLLTEGQWFDSHICIQSVLRQDTERKLLLMAATTTSVCMYDLL